MIQDDWVFAECLITEKFAFYLLASELRKLPFGRGVGLLGILMLLNMAPTGSGQPVSCVFYDQNDQIIKPKCWNGRNQPKHLES